MRHSSPIRRLARGFRSLVGQKQFYRIIRLLVYEATFDVMNDPRTNGEAYLQSVILANVQKPVIFDIGANVGEWTKMLLGQGHADVHAFEPSADTFEMLRHNVHCAKLNRLALSDARGFATMAINHAGAGTNALTSGDGERVEVSTVDTYCEENGIAHIDLLKVDAEGYDLNVLRGARGMFEKKAIAVVQFEYNHRWMATRSFLKDVFDYLEPMGYRIGKLSGDEVQLYSAWTREMETYREGNYIAYLPEWITRFRTVPDLWT